MQPNKRKTANPELRQSLEDYQSAEGLSNSELGKQLGYSATQVSRYLNDKFEGDLEKFETKAEDILRTAPIRRVVAVETFETGVTDLIEGTGDLIIKTNGVGIAAGPAGIGKTVSAARINAKYPSSFLMTLSLGCQSGRYIAKSMFGFTKTRGYKKSNLNTTEWNNSRLKGSNRPILIDNAHRATASALKWIFDTNDATGCPIILFGNPEILDIIKRNDQHYSRIGICPPDIGLAEEEIPAIAHKILDQMCPQYTDALHDYAVKVASQRGHLRSLRFVIGLALEFMNRGVKDPRTAFRTAHTQLPRNYAL